MNWSGFYSVNLSTYCSLSFLHQENIVDFVAIVVDVTRAGEKITL